MDDFLFNYIITTNKKVHIGLKDVSFKLKSNHSIKNIPGNFSEIIIDIKNMALSFYSPNELYIIGKLQRPESSDTDEGAIFTGVTDSGQIFKIYLNIHTENVALTGYQLQYDIDAKIYGFTDF